MEILAGYDQKNAVIFSGIITEQVLKVDADGSNIVIHCNSATSIVDASNADTEPKFTLTFGDGIVSLERNWRGGNKPMSNPGSVTFQGNSTPVPGDVINIEGVFTEFGGLALVSSVTHEISDGNWLTTAELGMK